MNPQKYIPGHTPTQVPNSQNARVQPYMHLGMHTHRYVCTSIRRHAHVPAGVITPRCEQRELQTYGAYACVHTDTGGSHTDHARIYMLQPQRAPHTSKQGLLWGRAQCPRPRWHHHEVINAANRHQLPWSLTAAAGWGYQGLLGPAQCAQMSAVPQGRPPHCPSWPSGNPHLARAAQEAGGK